MKRVTKKERQRRKAEETAAREQFAKWISTKAQVSLIFVGPFFSAGMEGHLEQGPGDPDCLSFFGAQTSFRTGIFLARCAALRVGRLDNHVAVWLQGPTGLALILCDPERCQPDVAELLKLSGGRPS